MTEPTSALCAVEGCRKDGPPRQALPGSSVCVCCEDRSWDNWRTVTVLWPDLELALAAQGAGGEHVSGTKTPALVINVGVVEARARIRELTRFWVHVLIETTDTLVPPTGDADQLASFLGTNMRHLTRHPDPGITLGYLEDAREAAGLARRHVQQTGRRTYKPGIPCVEHGTDEHGQRVPCGGEYVAKVQDGMGYVPDLVCTVDSGHVMTPGGFRTLGRSMDKGGAERLLGAIVGRMGA